MKLNVGSAGHNLEGYLSLDCCGEADVLCDLTTGHIPMQDDEMEEIECSHTLEHIPLDYQDSVLKEFLRILKPGGRLHVVTPNFKFYALSLLDDGAKISDPAICQHFKDHMALLYRCDNWAILRKDCHYWSFTEEYLAQVMKDAGFVNVQIMHTDNLGPPHCELEGFKA